MIWSCLTRHRSPDPQRSKLYLKLVQSRDEPSENHTALHETNRYTANIQGDS